MNKAADLFNQPDDAAPPMSIAIGQPAPLSATQQAFNKLITQIETQRAKLNDWAIAQQNFRQKYQLDLLPLIQQHQNLKIQMIYQLDAAFDQKGLNKNERSQVMDLMLYLAEPILAERDDEALGQLVDKYRPVPRRDPQESPADVDDAQDEAGLVHLQALLIEITGMDEAEAAAFRDPAAIFQHIEAHLAQEELRYEAARAERQAKRKKTAKQIEKEAQIQAENAQINQSIREVYRKLASALHPDREPDPARRERKTDLMQRANQAYENNNLLKLLELQIELELIDHAALAALSEERLTRYILTLKAELKNLTAEVKQAALEFHHEYGIDPAERLTPATAVRFLAQEVQSARQQSKQFEREMRQMRDVTGVKAWLRTMRSLY